MSQIPVSKGLAILGDEVLSAFRKASGGFARLRDSRQTLSSCETACKRENQRFQLWSINLGLFQSSHSSLDYRLRQNKTVRSLVAALLTDLRLALDDRKSSRPIVIGEKTQRPLVASELSRDIEHDSRDLTTGTHAANEANIDAQSSLFGDESETSDSSSRTVDEKDLMTLYIEDVDEINDELIKVAMQIQSPSLRRSYYETHLHGEDDHEDKEVYTKVLQSYRKRGIEQTLLSARRRIQSMDQAKFSPELRDSDEFLIDRLSRANELRRQQFEDWKRVRWHSVKAATNAAVVADADDTYDKRGPHSLPTPTAEVALVKGTAATVSTPSISLLRRAETASTHQSQALTIHEPNGDLIVWPEVPSAVPTGEPWRVHLKHDLCPYLCTFPDCTQPMTLYENRDQWIQHEQWSHMCFWQCPKDETKFEDIPSYKKHVRTQHPTEMDQLLSEGVLATQRFLAKRQSRCCPFCDVELNGTEEIYDHIGRHLESVALLAIPTLKDRDLQSTSDVASSEAAREVADGSREKDFDNTLQVVFPENDLSSEHSSAEQGPPGLDFGLYLAKLPEQAQDHSVCLKNATQDIIQDSVPEDDSHAETSVEVSLRQPAKLPCFMMWAHTRDPNFYGRGDILQALGEVLLPSAAKHYSGSGKVEHAVLCGMDGIGKTSIAREFAFSRKDHFDAVFWITADDAAGLEHDFAQIAFSLGLENPAGSSNPMILRELAKGWLANPQRIVKQDTNSVV
ncbi:MAG: hypothetical protein Q9188_005899 [Gyalolechia gomerana]